ncbi:MAG: hypothetical protein AAF635_10720 [Cyanobacteria bacterium P01_C01_bin.69]
MINTLGLLLAVGLATIHISIGQWLGLSRGGAQWLAKVPQNLWTSFAGGISISYIFLRVFPELSQAQQEVEESGFALIDYFENHVYLLSLIGLAVFYGLEQLAVRSRQYNKKMTGENTTESGIFWLHITSFAIYNAILGYLFRESAIHGITECIILFFALGLHFLVNDLGLRQHHRQAYDRSGRWLLAGAIMAGWAIGQATHFNEAAIAAIWALVAGGVIFNVLKEERPDNPDSHFGLFAVGAAVYTVILTL